VFWFDLRYRINEALSSLKNVMLFKIPEYHLFVKIKIPRDDAKIIYRALPLNGHVGLYR